MRGRVCPNARLSWGWSIGCVSYQLKSVPRHDNACAASAALLFDQAQKTQACVLTIMLRLAKQPPNANRSEKLR